MTKQADKRKGTSPILRVSVVCDAELIDLWQRTLLIVSHDRAWMTAADLLKSALRRERASLSHRRGPGWIEDIESRYHKPKRELETVCPPKAPDSFVD